MEEKIESIKELLSEEEVTLKPGLTAIDMTEANRLLTDFVRLDNEERDIKTKLDLISEELKKIKEKIKDLFINMGVNAFKTQNRTIYLQRQIWAGTGEGASNLQITEALKALSLENYISYNHQSLSAYVREIARGNEDLCDEKGNIIAEPEDIIAVLPEPLNKLLKVTERIDVKIRK